MPLRACVFVLIHILILSCAGPQEKLQRLTADNVAHEESADEDAAHNEDEDEEDEE